MRLEITDDGDRVRVIRHLVGAGYRVYLEGGCELLDRWDLGDVRLAADRAGADVVICSQLEAPAAARVRAEPDLGFDVVLDPPVAQTDDSDLLLAEVGWAMRRPVKARTAGAVYRSDQVGVA